MRPIMPNYKYSYDTLLADTDINPKLADILNKNGIKRFGQLLIHDADYFLSFEKFGKGTLLKLRSFLKQACGTNDEESPGNWVFCLKDDAENAKHYIARSANRLNRAIEEYTEYRIKYQPIIDRYNKILELETEANDVEKRIY